MSPSLNHETREPSPTHSFSLHHHPHIMFWAWAPAFPPPTQAVIPEYVRLVSYDLMTFCAFSPGLKCPHSIFPTGKCSAHFSYLTSCWLFDKFFFDSHIELSSFSVFLIPFSHISIKTKIELYCRFCRCLFSQWPSRSLNAGTMYLYIRAASTALGIQMLVEYKNESYFAYYFALCILMKCFMTLEQWFSNSVLRRTQAAAVNTGNREYFAHLREIKLYSTHVGYVMNY